MVTEIRKVNKRIALYTDDTSLFKCFNKWYGTSHRVPYTQSGKMVGIDLYFDKQFTSAVRQIVNGQLMLDRLPKTSR